VSFRRLRHARVRHRVEQYRASARWDSGSGRRHQAHCRPVFPAVTTPPSSGPCRERCLHLGRYVPAWTHLDRRKLPSGREDRPPGWASQAKGRGFDPRRPLHERLGESMKPLQIRPCPVRAWAEGHLVEGAAGSTETTRCARLPPLGIDLALGSRHVRTAKPYGRLRGVRDTQLVALAISLHPDGQVPSPADKARREEASTHLHSSAGPPPSRRVNRWASSKGNERRRSPELGRILGRGGLVQSTGVPIASQRMTQPVQLSSSSPATLKGGSPSAGSRRERWPSLSPSTTVSAGGIRGRATGLSRVAASRSCTTGPTARTTTPRSSLRRGGSRLELADGDRELLQLRGRYRLHPGSLEPWFRAFETRDLGSPRVRRGDG